jgi:hypothetical protein
MATSAPRRRCRRDSTTPSCRPRPRRRPLWSASAAPYYPLSTAHCTTSPTQSSPCAQQVCPLRRSPLISEIRASCAASRLVELVLDKEAALVGQEAPAPLTQEAIFPALKVMMLAKQEVARRSVAACLPGPHPAALATRRFLRTAGEPSPCSTVPKCRRNSNLAGGRAAAISRRLPCRL